MSKVFYSQHTLNLKMTTLLNNLTENNDPSVSKEFYEKNRKIKEKYMRKILNPYHVFTKKQALSAQRKDNKYKQTNNNQYHNRTSKIKEKLFCPQDEIDLEQDLENEHKISQEIVKSIAQEALTKIWGDDTYFTARSMDVFVTKLRKLLKEDPNIEIVNIHGNGFQLRVL